MPVLSYFWKAVTMESCDYVSMFQNVFGVLYVAFLDRFDSSLTLKTAGLLLILASCFIYVACF